MTLRTRFQSTATNRLVDALPEESRKRFLDSTESVHLDPRKVLFDIDTPISHVYFPTYGVVSIVSAITTGEAVETGTIGREGMTGIPLLLGARRVSTQAFCQVEAQALRLPADAFESLVQSDAAARLIFSRYALAFLGQTEQNSVCNRLHTIRQRCARWLLETHDRVSGETFGLTQEFLAQMLGVRRATVSQIAAQLQREGLIQYEYRQITVLDRAGLEAAACDCYRITAAEYARLIDNAEVPSVFASVSASSRGETTLEAPTSAGADEDAAAHERSEHHSSQDVS
jgi:CRP-like cAMP-binding protein